MYDIHGTEEGFQNTFNPNNIDPNQIFRMFFQQAGGDPFANLFNGGGSSFTVYTNTGGNQFFRSGGGMNNQHARQQRNPFGGGPNVDLFDLLTGGATGQTRRRRTHQHQHHTHEEDDDHDDNPFNLFQQQRYQRGRNNQQARARQPTNEAVVINLANQCFP